MSQPLRIGILGAAGIAPTALITPAAGNPDVEVAAIAARDTTRAREFAEEHGIATVHTTYADVVADDSLDAIYVPLPNSHHQHWAIETLRAGKHLLLEKPFTNNTQEAIQVAEVAGESGKVCMEAFHNRYHPIVEMVIDMLPRLGRLERVESAFNINLPQSDNIRYLFATGGGATMDLGCYPVHLLRSVLGSEPTVVSATHRPAPDPRVDEALTAKLVFGDVAATVTSSLLEEVTEQSAIFTGSDGTLRVDGFVHPQNGNQLVLETAAGRKEFTAPTSPTSYEAQLAAFVAAIRHGGPILTGPEDSVATMRVLDAMYLAAGLPLRGTVGA